MNEFSKTDLSEIYRCLTYMTKGCVTPYSCHTVSLARTHLEAGLQYAIKSLCILGEEE